MNNTVQKILPKIVVAGVGGAGGNAVNNMILAGTSGVDFIVLNTDAQALVNNNADTKIQLGSSLTEGLGAGAKPEVGRNAANETLDDIMQHLDSANMVFITAGMGGGTGTGAAPVIAKACRERGILTVGVVTKPFHFEGTHRMKMAEEGIAEMQSYVDTLIVIPNQNLFRVVNEKTTFAEAFKLADGVLQAAVRGVTDLIVNPGVINLDFADIRSVMLEMGKAVMGMGEATGDRRASEAAEKAINNPLLDDVSMKGARGVIVNIAGGYDMTLFEVDEACNRIRDEVDANANIIFGSSFDEKMEGIMRVSVIATGIDAAQMAKATRAPQSGAFVVERTSQQTVAQQRAQTSSVTRTAAPVARPVYQSVYQQPAVAVAPKAEAVVAPSAPTYAQIAQASVVMQSAASRFVQQTQIESVTVTPQPASTPAAYDEAQLQNSVRGARYQGAFIPPEPQESGRDHNASYQNWSGGTPHAQSTTTAYAQTEIRHDEQAYAPATEAAATSSSRRKSPSLFERITGGIRREINAVRSASREELSFAEDGNASNAVEQNVRQPQSMQARKTPELPVQGRLNIDAPSAPASSDSELDIPAFLRRQAN